MKNIYRVKASLIVTIAVIAALAFSCAPPLEETGYDWDAANAKHDPAQNSGYTLSDFTPSASITNTTADSGTITAFAIDITFKPSADVLRGEITAASLGFITFHTFTKNATDDLTADTLSAAIPFTLENRAGDKVTVKLTTTINTASAYSNLIFRVDGKKYTYGNGLRLDIDGNGKIEAVYDDFYTQELNVSGTGSGTKATGYRGPAYTPKFDVSISSVFSSSSFDLDDYETAAEAPATPSVNEFFFTGNGTTTNSNTLQVAQIGYIYSTTTDAREAYYKDIGDTLAKGIKLQKLNGTTWADVKTAEYDDAAPSSNPVSWSTYIVIKGVTFDHLATYRVIWTGSANTETSGTYYGVKVRLYIDDGNAARPLNRTQVVGDDITPVNGNLASFISSFSSYGNAAPYSFDSEGKNVVLRVLLNGYYWKTTPALADFKKSFQIVYSNATDNNGDPIAPGNTNPALAYVDVSKIEYKAEGSAIVGGVEKGKNVLYITLDPKFVYDPNAAAAHQNWLTSTYNPWEAASHAYQQYQSALQQYNADKQQYDTAKAAWDLLDTAYQPYATWLAACTAYEAAGGTVGDGGDGTDTDGLNDPGEWTDPIPQDPGTAPVAPTAPTTVSPPGPEPTYTGPKGTDLYFRVNDDISISDNAATNPTVFIFGNPDNFAYDYFEFYPVF